MNIQIIMSIMGGFGYNENIGFYLTSHLNTVPGLAYCICLRQFRGSLKKVQKKNPEGKQGKCDERGGYGSEKMQGLEK